MKLSYVFPVVLTALLAAGASAASGHSRSMLAVDTSCTAFAFLSIEQRGIGKCEGVASANCTILEGSKSSKEETFRTWINDGLCAEEAQIRASEGLADAVGLVWGDALSSIKCYTVDRRTGIETPKKYGCGWSIADPDGWAASFAQTLVEAWEKVAGESTEDLDGFCVDDLVTVKKAFASDADDARARVCDEDGASSDSFHIDYSNISQGDVLDALKLAVSGFCGEQSKESACAADDGPKDIKMCPPKTVERCCTARAIHHDRCVCSRCHNPLHLVSSDESGTIWEDSVGEQCKCPAVS